MINASSIVTTDDKISTACSLMALVGNLRTWDLISGILHHDHRPYTKGYKVSEVAWMSALQNVGRNLIDPNILHVEN